MKNWRDAIKLCALACALLVAAAAAARGQEFSTDPRNPTRLDSPNMAGRVLPEKGKSFYVTFLAGPGDVTFDAAISPKENNGAVFYWVLHRSVEDAARDMPWCPENLYMETAKRTRCVVTSGDRRTRQVVLKFGAYPNGEPVALDYKLTLGGDWKPIPPPEPPKRMRRARRTR